MNSKRIFTSLVLLLASGLGVTPAAAQTPVEVGYRDFSFGSSVNTPSGEKPESKLWWNDGSWWGVLFNAAAAESRIYRFDSGSQAWTDTGTPVDDRSNTRADVLWDDGGQRLYVVSHLFTTSASASSSSSQWGKLWRFSYNSTTREYTLEAGFPVNVTRGRCEALTIAKDASQRLWVTFVESRKVKINWSVSSDLDWGVPVDLPLGSTAITVNSDDISAIVGLPNGDIGVGWSNQVTNTVYFAIHRSVDAPLVWQPLEIVVPGPGCSGQCADDHLSLKTDQAGRVFLALKTSHEEDDPLIILGVRDGTWSRYTVGVGDDHHTRPIVVLDEESRTIYVFAAHPESGGAIYVKTSSLDDIQFAPGIGEHFIFSSLDAKTNNATSTKQNVSSATGLLVLASDQDTNRYLHNFLPLGSGTPLPPQPPANLNATAISPTQVDLTWNDGSSDETAFHLERRTGTGSFVEIAILGANVTAHSDQTAEPDTDYTYRVRAKNDAGFSNYSNSDQVTTPPVVAGPPSAPTGLDAEAISSSQVDLSWTDTSDNETAFHIERAIGGGGFTEIDTVAANIATYSDVTTTGNTTYSYRVRAKNSAGFSSYSNTDVAITPPAPDPGTLKVISFESGFLTGPVNGVDTVAGTVQLETAAPLKQTYSARIPGTGSSFLQEDFTPAADFYVSAYLRIAALPTSDVRLLLISNDGTSVGSLLFRTTGRLRLREGSTSIGLESQPLVVGQLYRIGVHQKSGTGNAVLEAFLASGDDAFGAPFAATTAGTWTTSADRLRLGATTGATVNVVFDDIVLATLAMPGPSTGGGTAPPLAPTGLSAVAISSGQVDLSWTDNSNAETTFHIERRLTGGSDPFQEIDTVGANVTTYSDATVAPETGYSYRVFAVNGQGPSGFSNTDDVTTPPVAGPPGAPTSLDAVAADSNRVNLSWADNATNEAAFHVERAPAGGQFVEIDTVGANVTTYSDLTVNPESSYTYQVRASNGQGFSAYSNTADVTTPPTSGGGTIKTMTFESGSLLDPTTGADSISGTVVLETAAPLKGAISARVPGTSSSYLNENFTAAGDLYVSFYLRLVAIPGSDTRIALISNNGESVGSLLLRTTGRLRLRLGSTTIGAESVPLLAGQLYRIGVHQKAGSGNAVLEAFIATGDAAFGTPFASTSTGTWTTSADRLRLGSTTGVVDAVFDDVTLDTVAMPGPSE